MKYIGVSDMAELVRSIGLEKFFQELSEYMLQDYRRWHEFDHKPRPASHSPEGTVEVMPACDGKYYSFKYVNNHPGNHRLGLQSVIALGLYADMKTGYPVLLSEMTIATALRTAVMSVLAARYLTRKNSKTMAVIGNGSQSEFQTLAFHYLLGIEEFRIYDRDPTAMKKFQHNMKAYGLGITACTNAGEAVLGADIITTATSDKVMASILSDNMVSEGVHINAIGGDCHGKTELQPGVLLRGDVYVELAEQTRIEGEIQQMPKDFPVTELWEVVTSKKTGRTSSDQITIFDSVGYALEDFSILRYLHDKTEFTGCYETLDILAAPADSRDLFSLFGDKG